MNIRIDIEQVRKVVNPEAFFCYFGAVLIADSGNGQEVTMPLKPSPTKPRQKNFLKKMGSGCHTLTKKSMRS